MGAGADGIIDTRLEDIGLGVAISFLPPPDVVGAVLAEQAVPTVGRPVIVEIAPIPVPNGADVGRKGSSHATAAITCIDGGVAWPAGAAGSGGQLRTEDAYQP